MFLSASLGRDLPAPEPVAKSEPATKAKRSPENPPHARKTATPPSARTGRTPSGSLTTLMRLWSAGGVVAVGAARRGRTANRAMLEAAAAADPASQALLDQARGRGRPGLNPSAARTGRSEVWRVRHPDDLGVAIEAQAQREGRKVPELIGSAARIGDI